MTPEERATAFLKEYWHACVCSCCVGEAKRGFAKAIREAEERGRSLNVSSVAIAGAMSGPRPKGEGK